ncbi:MAG TPA: tetratricopeptide repeat protein, partial [Bryobacterales bacterium]|nr:tetratricopeptide repeat protein [Bryobacterales bacterium]
RAVPILERLAKTTSGKERARVLLLAARTQGRLGDVEGAIASYASLASEYKAYPAATEAWRKIGLLRLDQGRYTEAEEAFQRALDTPAAGALAEELEWKLAWTQVRQGKFQAADEHFRAWIEKGSAAPHVHYWHARLALARGDRDSAVTALRVAAAPASPSCYAVFARILLRKLGVTPPEPEKGPERFLEPVSPRKNAETGVRRSEALYGLGFFEWARADSWALHGRPSRLSAPERLGWGVWYQQVGDFARATRFAGAGFRSRAGGYPRYHDGDPRWRLAYPRAFRDKLEGIDWPDTVPEDLVYAIMRQESRFDTWAVSPAGARGPMQLMPETAREVARRLGMPAPSTRLLHDPRTAVTLGAWLLAGHLERYGGNLPLAIAAYNAGEAAVDRWLEERPGLPIDVFLEEISYAETRNYVRKVLANLWVYSRLYGRGLADFADEIPLEPASPLPVVSGSGGGGGQGGTSGGGGPWGTFVP